MLTVLARCLFQNPFVSQKLIVALLQSKLYLVTGCERFLPGFLENICWFLLVVFEHLKRKKKKSKLFAILKIEDAIILGLISNVAPRGMENLGCELAGYSCSAKDKAGVVQRSENAFVVCGSGKRIGVHCDQRNC